MKSLVSSALTEFMPGWYVIFSNKNHWLSAFLKDGFSHCEAIEISKEGVGLCLSFGSEGLYVSSQPINVIRDVIFDVENITLFVPQAVLKNIRCSRVFYLMTCVTVVKMALGIESSIILTPYGLFKYLINNGAKTIT